MITRKTCQDESFANVNVSWANESSSDISFSTANFRDTLLPNNANFRRNVNNRHPENLRNFADTSLKRKFATVSPKFVCIPFAQYCKHGDKE